MQVTGPVSENNSQESAEALPPTEDRWGLVGNLSCQLTIDVLVPKFRVSTLLSIAKNSVIDTHWQVGNDVPLRVNGELLAWCEFEAVDTHLAVRLTGLA